MQAVVTLLFVGVAMVLRWHHRNIKKLNARVNALEHKNKKMMGKA